ncbi:hypothetical protein [Mycolicibacterium sp. CH28]|uniref:hypothetical protein n=1 Tax=Mycolicibacterium sp. CH28 TaxID=2512237 RepID=UPI0013876518|nr:hypothetical protein [Mycolicibacterium sp. CH28]
MSITAELQRARRLALAAQEEAAKELLLSLMPEIEREDRDDLALEVFAQLGEIYLTRTAYDGTRECLRRMTDCLGVYSEIRAGTRPELAANRYSAAEIDQMIGRYTLWACFLRTGLAAAAGDHEEAARELAGLRDDEAAHRFAGLATQQRHLSTLAAVLCATALSDDDLHVPASALWQNIIPIVEGLRGDSDEDDQLLVAAGIAYGRFCVETGRLAEGERWLHRAGARAQRRGWELYWARAELESAAASWMRGDHESTERLVGSAYPVIARHSRAHDVARCWMYFGLTRLGFGWVEEADESWAHAETQWRELGRPLYIHRILLQRSWISVFRGRFADAVEQVAQARECLDNWPRSSWLQYARLDDHLGSIWRADALADLNFDGIGDPADNWRQIQERQEASLGVTRFDAGSERHHRALAKLKLAADLKIPAALAVDSVRYAMTDADARWRWASQVSARMLAGAFAVAWESENHALLSELIEYHCARGTFDNEPLGEIGGWDAPATVTVPVETLADDALAAGGHSVGALTLTTLGPLPPVQMEPGGGPILAGYRALAHDRYGQAVTSSGPAWSTWP